MPKADYEYRDRDETGGRSGWRGLGAIVLFLLGALTLYLAGDPRVISSLEHARQFLVAQTR